MLILHAVQKIGIFSSFAKIMYFIEFRKSFHTKYHKIPKSLHGFLCKIPKQWEHLTKRRKSLEYRQSCFSVIDAGYKSSFCAVVRCGKSRFVQKCMAIVLCMVILVNFYAIIHSNYRRVGC